ncbi:MAG: DUF4349 domain-containing protein [Actinomycetota bacterium]
MFTRRTVALGAIALVMMGLVGACSGGGDDEGSSDGGGGGRVVDEQADALGAPAAREAFDTAASGYGGDEAAQAGIPALPPRVIKTADIRLGVPKDEFEAAIQESVDVAERHGGFVNSTTIDDDDRRGSVTIRVPAEQFEAALGQLKEIGDVAAETISGTDVSQEFVDLAARMRNLEAQETVLLRLMEKATTVLGTIRVQRELQPIQLEIERLQGRINFLEDQTDLSTITVTFTPAGAAPSEPAGAFERAWDNAKDTFVAVLSAVVVGAGFVIPVALILALVGLAVRWVRPRLTG